MWLPPPFYLFPACNAEVEKVCSVSSEEHVQPFKDKMEEFLSQGEPVMLMHHHDAYLKLM